MLGVSLPNLSHYKMTLEKNQTFEEQVKELLTKGVDKR